MNNDHISGPILERYAAGGAGTPDLWWAVEAHLESCPACRDRLGEVIARHGAMTGALLERVRQDLIARIADASQAPIRRRRRPFGWAGSALLRRLGATVLVVLAALALDLADAAGRLPSLVLMLAPVAPLLPVAAVWSRGLDPAYELVVASPRAGLELVLRRTVAVVVIVIPVLAGAGALAGASPARWLLPCLAFTTGALALGELVGVHRAATGLALAWAAVVVAPGLLLARPPVVLDPAAWPGWAAAVAAITVLLVVRRHSYAELASTR